MKKILIFIAILLITPIGIEAQSVSKSTKKPVKKTTKTVPAQKKSPELLLAETMAKQQYDFRRVGDYPYNDQESNIDGLIPGWTTAEELKALGGTLTGDSEKKIYYQYKGLKCTDYNGIICRVQFDTNSSTPNSWKKLKLNSPMQMSYDQWMKWFNDNNYQVHLGKRPKQGKPFNATITGTNEATGLVIQLQFNRGKEKTTSDANTLSSIIVARPIRVFTNTSAESNFNSLFGITPGKTTQEQLKNMGFMKAAGSNYYDSPKGWMGTSSVAAYFSYDGTLVTSFMVHGRVIPYEWASPGQSNEMTYRKWKDLLMENGFVIFIDSLQDQYTWVVKGYNERLSILIKVEFNCYNSTDPTMDPDNPEKINYFSIKYNYDLWDIEKWNM